MNDIKIEIESERTKERQRSFLSCTEAYKWCCCYHFLKLYYNKSNVKVLFVPLFVRFAVVFFSRQFFHRLFLSFYFDEFVDMFRFIYFFSIFVLPSVFGIKMDEKRTNMQSKMMNNSVGSDKTWEQVENWMISRLEWISKKIMIWSVCISELFGLDAQQCISYCCRFWLHSWNESFIEIQWRDESWQAG